LANVYLTLEYEAGMQQRERLLAPELSRAEVDIFVTAVVVMAEPVESHFQ